MLAVVLSACVDDPSVEIVTGDPVAPMILIHGTGESGSDISARWGMPDAVAPDDVSSIAGMIEPGERAILLGQGSGASIAYDLACARPDLVSAVVMLSGEASDAECVNGSAVSVLTVHGTVDDVIPYSSATETFEKAKQIAQCSSVAFVDSPDIGASVEALSCLERTDGRTRSATHWRVIGWDHNPVLGETWAPAVDLWLSDL